MNEMHFKVNTHFVITAALIAAAYAGLTYLAGFIGIAYGPVQFRFSEVLTILPVFTPAAIPGLAIGCFFANIASFSAVDMLFGTAATLVAAMLTYLLRRIYVCRMPLFSFFPPVIVNAIVIGFELSWLYLPSGITFYGTLGYALAVGAGQLVVCVGLGIPFYFAVDQCRIFKSGE